MQNNFQGMMQTVWSDAESFLKGFYSKTPATGNEVNTPWNCFQALYQKMEELKVVK